VVHWLIGFLVYLTAYFCLFFLFVSTLIFKKSESRVFALLDIPRDNFFRILSNILGYRIPFHSRLPYIFTSVPSEKLPLFHQRGFVSDNGDSAVLDTGGLFRTPGSTGSFTIFLGACVILYRDNHFQNQLWVTFSTY
jgi:hypothetical protein